MPKGGQMGTTDANILIIGHDTEDSKAFSTLIAHIGYNVICATDQESLKLLATPEQNFDATVMLNLEDTIKDKVLFIQWVKTFSPQIGIVVASKNVNDLNIDKCRRLKINACIGMDSNTDTLARALERAIDFKEIFGYHIP